MTRRQKLLIPKTQKGNLAPGGECLALQVMRDYEKAPRREEENEETARRSRNDCVIGGEELKVDDTETLVRKWWV